MKKSLIATILLCSTLLSGCLVPEKFSAKVEVQPDASYTFTYLGTAVHAMAASQIKKTGTLSEKDENGLKRDAEKYSKNKDIQKLTYKGAGRYELNIKSQKKAGESLRMLNIFNVRTDQNGIMTISSNEIKEKDKKQLEQLGITIDGKFEIVLPKNAKVISKNATSTPTFFGLFGTYSWKIGRIDQRPLLTVKLKPQI